MWEGDLQALPHWEAPDSWGGLGGQEGHSHDPPVDVFIHMHTWVALLDLVSYQNNNLKPTPSHTEAWGQEEGVLSGIWKGNGVWSHFIVRMYEILKE